MGACSSNEDGDDKDDIDALVPKGSPLVPAVSEDILKATTKDTDTGTIHSNYTLLDELGKGSFATVVRGVHKKTGVHRAVKIINRSGMKKENTTIGDEIAIMRKCGQHKNIIHLYDVFHDETNYYLVMELCEGGDLFGKIISCGGFTERDAAVYCRQLAEALLYMHSQGVTHRDLKPENLFLSDKSDNAVLKVADFGLSKLVEHRHEEMKTVCGTWAYAAPEVIRHKSYHESVDAWSVGVLQFVLLGGYHPFDVYGDLPEPTLLRRIVKCNYDFDDDAWDHISQPAKTLIKKLLVVDPEKRMTLEDYVANKWLHPDDEVPRKKLSDVEKQCPVRQAAEAELNNKLAKFIERLNQHKTSRLDAKRKHMLKKSNSSMKLLEYNHRLGLDENGKKSSIDEDKHGADGKGHDGGHRLGHFETAPAHERGSLNTRRLSWADQVPSKGTPTLAPLTEDQALAQPDAIVRV